MLYVLLAVFIVVLILAEILLNRFNVCEGLAFVAGIISFFGIIATLIAILFIAPDVNTEFVIDQKIQLYEQENAIIEQRIDTIVQEYMAYEKETYADLSAVDPVARVALFPELKSDTMVQSQIQTYTQNWEKIMSLKEEKVNLITKRWWLSFGN
ncbi:MAG: hypothetical protein IKK43_00150 [Clostridia bacterium]|nr:hypothetical protein [Clostridia bacterium]